MAKFNCLQIAVCTHIYAIMYKTVSLRQKAFKKVSIVLIQRNIF